MQLRQLLSLKIEFKKENKTFFLLGTVHADNNNNNNNNLISIANGGGCNFEAVFGSF